ncbi:bifunctional glutamate N-acetyltransferase/amino-acid acetyltransferase ArgJ [Candidatus Pelagibacter sp. RS39]|uniref:bifunctional glutamate N-acetyltransferase/amino-acid acetyltransferase ArgJ n=1 Tax=Candidatus Pelagibacter sp. RS39 TaxID=1977864 RepID=UPI000A1487F1|nr:bifunctional glutamate N-acetyltransferase/amino-acid acetyltransferase ArgJ [Candidatus Pelagibacter sp. RS39]ARJ47459.1 bifunctional ornithine acetyltransferase/N-acetylglutamate synthase [Candidatus Pelagibacter sp. RS39]
MRINLSNFLTSKSHDRKMGQYQDLDHLDGLAISSVSANLYNSKRDDLAMFYFRDGANFASLYTQSKILSENIKWNLSQKTQKIFSLIVNTRNANSFTGEQGYKSMQHLADLISKQLTEKQKEDENDPKIIKPKNLIFGCTGTIGEKFPEEKIRSKIPELIKNIKYTQNKYIWMKVALSIMTTDTQPKIAMEECKIGSTAIKIYGVAKGSGMIQPNMATTLAYVFTDADISNDVLKKLLKKNIENTFNAISCDSDTSTNDMISIFSTGKAKNTPIKTINDKKIKSFDEALNSLLLNLAKRVVADGEGASKFITINVLNSKSEHDAKKIGFSIANSPLVKTAIAGEDPNWGRIIMAIGKSDVDINLNKLSIKFGDLVIVSKGKIHNQYDEIEAAKYMKGLDINLSVDIGNGKKSFTVYTMDLTNEYIKINSDYRS